MLLPIRVGDGGGGASVDGDVLPEGVVVADDELGLLALIFEVLGASSEGGEGKGLATFPDNGVAFNDNVTTQTGVGSQSRHCLR